MKNSKARNTSGDDWITPIKTYEELDREFKFDYDPCPYKADFDSLELKDWPGKSIFVNPPYSRKLKEAFIKKSYEESAKGKLVVLLLPVSTSTTIFQDLILKNAAEIRFIRGRIKFMQKDSNGNLYTPGVGQHDSMLVIFDGRKKI